MWSRFFPSQQQSWHNDGLRVKSAVIISLNYYISSWYVCISSSETRTLRFPTLKVRLMGRCMMKLSTQLNSSLLKHGSRVTKRDTENKNK